MVTYGIMNGAKTPLPTDVAVAIIGSGFSGLAAAAGLRRDGVDDFVILERASDLGGTWRDNSYPGAACDVPSQLYSFDFALNPTWTRSFSPQPEILEYLRACAHRYRLVDRIYLDHEVERASWDETSGRWHVRTRHGSLTAQVLVSAAGPLSDPRLPDIPGIDTFQGTTFHSATWRHDHDLTGERVAVIGTGASAIQFVPQIQPKVERLHLFQRTPPWVVPRGDRQLTELEHRIYRNAPALQRLTRAAIYYGRELYVFGFTIDQRLLKLFSTAASRHLAKQVPDPGLRARLTPSYTMGCKRVLISSDYYPAVTKANVELVTDAVTEVRPHSVVTADGREREVDTLICGTGFHVTDPPIAQRIFGAEGRSLADTWRDGMFAYKGTTVPGYPNMFFLLGPNTGGGHTSVVLMAEAQLQYLRGAVRFLREHGVTAVDVRQRAAEDYHAAVQRRMRTTVWVRGGCQSWYLDDRGHNTTLWPSFVGSFRRRTARFDRASYLVDARPRDAAPMLTSGGAR